MWYHIRAIKPGDGLREKEEHPMKKQAIEKMYTEKVAELLNQGWHINTTTMPGHQGEVAHIDLTDGTEIRRALLYREMVWGRDSFDGHKICIVVGRSTDRVYPGWDCTIWNNRLEPVFQIEWADIGGWRGNGWYTDLAEGRRIQKLQRARRRSRGDDDNYTTAQLGEAYKSAALRWVQKQPRMKTCKLSDIEKVIKVTCHGNAHYEITAKGKTFRTDN
mgnify:CR=1 FL=1